MNRKENKILSYWNQDTVESMYDKNLLGLEIELIRINIQPGSKVLDVGCGEGEATLEYSKIEDSVIYATDFSETRLKKAQIRTKECENISFKKINFLKDFNIDKDFDTIISQRFLINLISWDNQKKVLLKLLKLLKINGRILILEGYKEGVEELNEFRKLYGLEPIPVKWHNLFLHNNRLINFMNENGFELFLEDGLGDYFLLTRGVRPYFDEKLNWDDNFNRISSNKIVKKKLGLNEKFSRLKLWGFRRINNYSN